MALELELSFDELTGDALDSSGNGRNLTIAGNTVRTGSGHANGGLTQNANDVTLGPSLSGLQTTSRTSMFWVNYGAGPVSWIFEFYKNPSDDTGVWGLLLLGGTLRWRAKNSSGSVFESSSIPIDTGNWHHIAATHDGVNLKLYRDGVLFSTTPMASAVWTADVFRLFDQTGSSVKIDDVRHFSTALTEPEIATWMNTPAGSAPANEGTLSGSFSSPAASLSANGSVDAVLSGAFSSPSSSYDGTATAEVTLSGTFAAPAVSLAAAASAAAELAGSFAAPVFSSAGGSVSPNDAGLNGSFSTPSATFSARSSVDVSMIGTFSIPVFTASGGMPTSDRDILVTIGPGERPATSIAAGPSRVNVAQSDLQRTEIGE